jgi:hypothetical protein
MEEKKKPGRKPKPKLVKMYRERDGKFADVHPLEVDNYKLGDWRLVDGNNR